MNHFHHWTLFDRVLNRYRCACRVFGARKGSSIRAYQCQHELDGRKHCGADAVHVTSNRQSNRCAEHLVTTTQGVQP